MRVYASVTHVFVLVRVFVVYVYMCLLLCVCVSNPYHAYACDVVSWMYLICERF